MKNFIILFSAFVFLVSCKKDENHEIVKPSPEPKLVKCYYKITGKKGVWYSLGFNLYTYKNYHNNRDSASYSSPLIIDSLTNDYMDEPLTIWVPYPGLKLKGDYYIDVVLKSGGSKDSLRFNSGGGGGPIPVPFVPSHTRDSTGYYWSLGSGYVYR